MSKYSLLQHRKFTKVGPNWCDRGCFKIFHSFCRKSCDFPSNSRSIPITIEGRTLWCIVFFSKKVFQCRIKTEKRDPLGFFQHPFCRKPPKTYSKKSQKIEITSELLKRHIRTLKTLYPNFENDTSELWKRYIRTFKTIYPNFKNVISEF